MKPILLLLFCFGLFPVLAQEPHMKELPDYYKNGSLKCKTIVIYNAVGSEEKTITETYRKDGTRRYRSVMNTTDLLQYTKYDKQGKMRFERTYYYSGPFLHSVETRRANGNRQVWTQPPPSEEFGCFQYATYY